MNEQVGDPRSPVFPALEEYRASLAEAEAAEAKARNELDAQEVAGKLVELNGKLP